MGFFFFKQKTAYEMRISDWSSDVCSSDLAFHLAVCEASHNPVLTHTLQSLTDLMLGSVFACVNNLYHRQPHKQQIDNQHAGVFNTVIGRLPDLAHQAATDHVNRARTTMGQTEKADNTLDRATPRAHRWDYC